MPVPMTDWPTNRPAVLDSPVTTGELNVRLLDPLVVALLLSVICVDELIAAIVVPAGMPVPVTDSPTNSPAVLDSPVTTGELNVRLLDPLAVAAVVRVIVPAVEPIEAIVSPAGMPVPVTYSPTYRVAAKLNVRLVPPAGPPGLVAVAFWLRVMAVAELIAEIVVPVGMPVPETGSPTTRARRARQSSNRWRSAGRLPVKTVVSPVTVVDPLVVVPVKLAVFSVPVKLTVFSVPVKLVVFSVPVRAVPAPGRRGRCRLVARSMKTAAYAGVSVNQPPV